MSATTISFSPIRSTPPASANTRCKSRISARGDTLPERIERVTSAAWASDNRTLFYTVEDETTKRSHRLYRHTLELHRTRRSALRRERRALPHPDRAHPQRRLSSAHHRQPHHQRSPLPSPPTNPQAEFRMVAPREDTHEYYADHHPGPEGETSRRHLLHPHQFHRPHLPPDDRLGRRPAPQILARSHSHSPGRHARRPPTSSSPIWSLFEREDGLPYLRIVDLPHSNSPSDPLAASHRIEFTEPAYNAALGANPEFATDHLRFQYESFVTPRSVFDYDLENTRAHPPQTATRPRRLRPNAIRQRAPSRHRARRHAHPHLHRPPPRHASRRLLAPLLLYGYGSYGISIPVSFNSNRLSLLDRGVIFAIAHIRGGGELGKPWHDAGRMHKKLNTFTDFIASAEHLIAAQLHRASTNSSSKAAAPAAC